MAGWLMNYLNEQEIKLLIKEEIFKKAASKVIEEQLRSKLSNWIASKIPGTSAQSMEQALATVAKEEAFQDLNIDDFIAKIREELASGIEKSIGQYLEQVIGQAVKRAASSLGK